jgi:hypothetical protein
VVRLDEAGAREELHDHAGGDDGLYAQFHQGAAVGREDHPEIVEGVTVAHGNRAVEGNFRHDEVDDEDYARPDEAFIEADASTGGLHLRHDEADRPEEVQESPGHCVVSPLVSSSLLVPMDWRSPRPS